jgi:hypothetical protein
MPISLDAHRDRLLGRIHLLDRAFDRHLNEIPDKRRFDRSALQEGLVSALWQSWGSFNREVVIRSALGATTRSGLITNSPFQQNTESEILFASKKFASNQTFNKIRPIGGSHLEPTWGDITKLARIIQGLGTSNTQTLLSGFGIARHLMILKLCRNAGAHINSDLLGAVVQARVSYNNPSFRHPSDMIFWIDPATSDFLWRSWISEIEVISDLATQ